MEILPDFSHIAEWPPQPSSVMGFGLMLAGIAVLVATGGVGVELGVPLLLGGAGMVVMPDSSSEHREQIKDLQHGLSSLRAEGHRTTKPEAGNDATDRTAR